MTRAANCPHVRVRCIHGDEIIRRMTWRGTLRRQACLDCGAALDRDLPDICSSTGAPH